MLADEQLYGRLLQLWEKENKKNLFLLKFPE